MATDPIIPFQYLAFGSADSAKTGANFDELLKYIRDRNDGTTSWDVVKTVTLTVTGNATVGGTLGVTGVATLSGGIVTPSINTTGVWGFRNRIINGDMRIDQRNEGASLIITGGTRQYSLDRWFGAEASDAVFTIIRSTTTPPTGFTHHLRVTVTTADASLSAAQANNVSQRVEGQYIKDFLLGSSSAKVFVLSFWVRSSLTGTFSVGFTNSAGDRSYPTTYTINAANTWEQKTITVAGDTTGTWLTTNGIGMRVVFDMGSGTDSEATANTWGATAAFRVSGSTNVVGTLNATWDITGVQLEIGSSATSFEYRPDPVEFHLCQRYYEKTIPQGTAAADNPGTTLGALTYRGYVAGTAGANGQYWQYKVTKRAAPTITLFNPSATGTAWRNSTDGADSGASGTANIGDNSAYITNAQVAGDGVGEVLQIHAVASAEL